MQIPIANFRGAAENGRAVSMKPPLDNVGNVRLTGPLGERLDAMIERSVEAADVDCLTAPFMEKTEREWRWQTEFWGKWMHSAAPFAVYARSAKLRAMMERGARRIIESQEPSGYIGNYPDELRCGEGWDVWGMKYTMMGLLHYHDWAKAEAAAGTAPSPTAEEALAACRRLCDYVIAELGPGGRRRRELWETGSHSGYASSSILEPVVWLFWRTGEKRYADFAACVVKGMEEPAAGPRLVDLALDGVPVADRNGYGNTPGPDGNYVNKHNRSKAYEMLSCYQGILDFCAATGTRPDAREAAFATARDVAATEITLAGGASSGERWFHGARKQHLPYLGLQETCVTTTWMRLCERLLDETGDPWWADHIERSFYNAYLAAMKPDGSAFAAYTPLSGYRWPGHHHCFMHIDCCTANGPRGFLCFLRELFKTEGDAAVFNFYASALVEGTVPATGRKVKFETYSLYPRTDSVRIQSRFESEEPVALKLRIPAWSAETAVKVNGEAQPGVRAGSYFTLKRPWRLGDVVEVSFDMPVVSHVEDLNVAFTRGPVLLARDSRFADGDMTEPYRRYEAHGGEMKDGGTVPAFKAVRTPSEDVWMAFSAVLPIGSHFENPEGRNMEEVRFCDYASAGNEWRPSNYYRTWYPISRAPDE